VTQRFVEKHGWDLTVLRPGFIGGRDHGYLAAPPSRGTGAMLPSSVGGSGCRLTD
jgi:hypothetical protein